MAFAAGYSAFGLIRHWRFESSFDLAIFDQAVWHLSRFQAPASSIRGYSNLLGDHFSPILALFAPLYWIAAIPETLIVAQSILLALSIVPVYVFARRRLPGDAALALSASYGFFWGMQRAAEFDVHEVAFAPLAVGGMILAMDCRRWGWFAVAALALALTKEDLVPLLVFVGLYLIVRGDRRVGSLLLASSAAAFVLIVGVAIPSAGTGVYGYRSTYADALQHPWRIPIALVTPGVKLLTMLLWVAPFALLPLASPLCTWLAPFAAERFLSSSPLHWGTIFHYSAPLAPIVAAAAADGLARIARRIGSRVARRRTVAVLAGVTVLLSAILPGHQPLLQLASPEFHDSAIVNRTGYDAIAAIPNEASVVAQAAVAPHIAHRDDIHILDAAAPDADYVVAAADRSPWPLTTANELTALLRARQAHGYNVVFEREGWIVLRRSTGPTRLRESFREIRGRADSGAAIVHDCSMANVAITREISPAIADCELTHLARVPIDVDVARAQHRAYEQALAEAGYTIERLPADAEMPDAVFVEDVAVVFEALAIITRPGAETRRRETPAVAAALERYRPLHFIRAPATMDGGDVLRVGRHVFVGVSTRTNVEAVAQMRRILAPHGYIVCEVAVRGCLHLKSAVTALADDLLLVNERWAPPASFPEFDLVSVDPNEPSAANALRLDDRIIFPTAFPRTAARLEQRGLRVVFVDASELAKAEGAVTCCSLLVDDL